MYWSPVKGSIVGTTIYNGLSYSIYKGGTDSAIVRFDTAMNRVYAKIYKNNYYPLDTNEFVLYDFSANVGDSLKTPYHNYVVKTKDSINIDGVKHYTFEIENTHRTLTIIEGIGSINDPLMPYLGFFFESQQRLVCFQNNGGYPKLSVVYTYQGFDNNISCKDTNGLGIENIFTRNNFITIVPNPANESSKIVFPYAIQQGRLVVTNAMGQVVLQKDFQNKEQIILGALPAEGLYIIQVCDTHNGNNLSMKFVYQ